MLSRKRKPCSHTTENQHLSPIGTRVRSDSWNSENRLLSSGQSSISVTLSGTVYEIKAIIGERKHSYLIDWENDSATGESFEPDWQPKANASIEAVKAWEAKKASSETSGDCVSTAGLQFHHSQGPNSSRLGGRSKNRHATAIHSRGITPSVERSQEDLLNRSASRSLETANLGDLIVRISQHSSLDRPLYIAYESSLQTQESVTFTAEQVSSREASDFLRSQSTYRSSGASDGVIPDSQSSLGSSSYVATASSADNIITDGGIQSTQSQDDPSGGLTQSSSHLLVPASQEYTRSFRRSRSAPVSTIPDSVSNPSSLQTLLSLPRSVSDPGQLSNPYDLSLESHCIEIPDSAEKQSSVTSNCPLLCVRPSIPASPTLPQEAIDHSPQDPKQHLESARFVIIEEKSQEIISQAITIDETVLGEIEPNSQSPRRSTTSSQKQSQPPGSQHSTWTPPVPPYTIDFVGSLQPREEPGIMANVPFASRDTPEDSAILGVSTASTSDSVKSSQEQILRLVQKGNERQRNVLQEQSPAKLRSPFGTSPKATVSPTVKSPSDQNLPTSLALQATVENQQSPAKASPIQRAAEPSIPVPGPPSPSTKQQTPTLVAFAQGKPLEKSPSPAVIPDRTLYQPKDEPSRLVVQPLEIDTAQAVLPPMRNTQLTPHAPMIPSKLSFHKEISLSPNQNKLEVCNLGDLEYPIHLSMSARIQQHYCATIKFHAQAIRSFLEDGLHDKETLEQVNTMLDEVSKVTTHIDLQGSGPSSQENVDPQREADYAESCSDKFVFLGQVLEEARNFELKICIVAKSGLLMNILAMYLRAKEIAWFRLDKIPEPGQTVRGSVQVLLLPSDVERPDKDLRSDLLIAFDETFIRENTRVLNRKNLPPPVLRLVVYASLEHIDLCVPRALNPIERLRKLVFPLLQTQKRVGEFKAGDPPPKFCAHIIAGYLNRSVVSNSERPWPLRPIRPIKGIQLMDSDSGLSDAASDILDELRPDGPIRYWPNPIPPKIIPHVDKNGKRPFDIEWGDSITTQAKKQRLAQQHRPGRTEIIDEDEPTDLGQRLQKAKERIDSVELELSKKTKLVTTLQSWAAVRQQSYEQLRKDMGDLQVSQHEASTDLARSARAVQDLRTKNETLTTNYSALQVHLHDLQASLNDHPDPAIAATARDLGHQRVLEAENASLKKTLANLQTDFDFTREQYQRASEMATENARELEPLKTEVADLQRKQELNIAEYRRLRDEDVTKELRRENQRLKMELAQRDRMLLKSEADNHELKRGRAGGMQTRGSSAQPKSPRTGSRGVSPAAGLLGSVGGGHAMARGGSGLGSSRFRE